MTPEAPSCSARQVGEEGHGERDRGVESRLSEPPTHRDRDDADEQPHPRRDDHRVAEAADRGPDVDGSRRAQRGRGDRRAQQHERGRVVDETLALEDGEQPRGQPEALADARRGDDVGRADDRPERDRGGEAEAGQDRDEREPGDERAHDDEHDRERRDRSEVATEVDDGEAEGRGVEQRRQDADEDDLGVDLDHRNAGQEAVADADDHEQQGRRDPEPPGERRRRDDDDDPGDGDERIPGIHAAQSTGGLSTSPCVRCAPRRRTACRSDRRCSPVPT